MKQQNRRNVTPAESPGRGPKPPEGGSPAAGTLARRRRWSPWLAALLLIVSPSPSAAQEADGAAGEAAAALDTARLVGQVVSAMTGEPLAGAVVSLKRTGLGAVTDSAGNFAVGRTVAGQDTVQVRYLGFETSSTPLFLEPERTTRVVLLLSPSVVRLADIRVEVEASERLGVMADFERRRKKGIGHFFGREEIEERDPRYTSDLLRHVPGVRVGPYRPEGTEIIMGRDAAMKCAPVIFLDGLYMKGLRIDDIPATTLGAVEVYRGASEVPVQFAQMAPTACGAILIWTRQGKRPGER